LACFGHTLADSFAELARADQALVVAARET
jgi:hypothetical protein